TSQVSAASATISAAKPSIPAAAPTVIASYTRRRKGVIIRDPEEELYSKTPVETPKLKDKGKVMKKRPQTESEARKNMMIYLKDTAGYKLDFFKGMSYDEIRPIFQARFDANMRFLLKSKEEMEEEDREHLEVVNDEDDDVFTEATPLARKNFDREDLEDLWGIVKERFSTSKPSNFSDEYLLTTLKTMFEKPDRQEAVWKSQRSVHGQALLILLVERRYPLSKFTLEQLMNVTRLQVEEESEMSLKLLRFTRQQLQEYQQG
nr:hypothetical protein [Tanacetum cinerariifolium]